MKLVPKEHRVEMLLKFGIPQSFVENIGKVVELEFMVEPPDGAYFYFPTITDYKIIADSTITPIYDCGETFHALVCQGNASRIIYFELEQDEIYKDYGLNWQLLLMNIMIEYFDSAVEDGISEDAFCLVGSKIGFSKSKELFWLCNVSVEEYNHQLADGSRWRMEIAQKLGIL